MKKITKIFAIMFAYFWPSSSQILSVAFIPLYMLVSSFDSRIDWHERRLISFRVTEKVEEDIMPLLTWIYLTVSIMIFWLKILDKYVYIGERTKVANGSTILLVITLLPFVIWWIRNEDIVRDLDSNLRMGENHRLLWSVLSQLFYLLQLAMPFVMLWLPI